MKLYLLSQRDNNNYDTYDSAVVAAPTPEEAIMIHPSSSARVENGRFVAGTGQWTRDERSWAYGPGSVESEYIGEAKEGTEAGAILASFNAG